MATFCCSHSAKVTYKVSLPFSIEGNFNGIFMFKYDISIPKSRPKVWSGFQKGLHASVARKKMWHVGKWVVVNVRNCQRMFANFVPEPGDRDILRLLSVSNPHLITSLSQKHSAAFPLMYFGILGQLLTLANTAHLPLIDRHVM